MPIAHKNITNETILSTISGDNTIARQSDLNSKQNTITGAATTIVSNDLVVQRVLISDVNGKISVGGATSGELNYLSGVTSSIQTQINNKLNIVDVYNIANSGRKIVSQMITAPTTALSTGDGQGYIHICSPLSNKNLVYCHLRLIAPGAGTGTTRFQIARNRSGSVVDILSTTLDIERTQTQSSGTYVINTLNDDMLDNDLLRIDVDQLTSTPGSGAIVTLGFE